MGGVDTTGLQRAKASLTTPAASHRPVLTLGPTRPCLGGANIAKTAPGTRFTSN